MGVMIGKWFLESHHGGPNGPPADVGFLTLKYLKQERKMNVENLKWIMHAKKTVKAETEKIKELLIYISI